MYINSLLTVEDNHRTIRSVSLSLRIYRVRIRPFLVSPFSLFPLLCLPSPWVDIILIAAAKHIKMVTNPPNTDIHMSFGPRWDQAIRKLVLEPTRFPGRTSQLLLSTWLVWIVNI